MLPIDENGNVDGWTRSSKRSEREKRVMTPIQFRAASSAHISSHSRELLFAKHARLESREKRELRSKKVELERDLRAALAARDRLVERLEDSETSLCEAEEQIRILKATEQVHVLANKNMANELEEERASAFDDQMTKLAQESASAETIKAMNAYVAGVESRAVKLSNVADRAATLVTELRERVTVLEAEKAEQAESIRQYEEERMSMQKTHAAEMGRLQEELQYLGKICNTMQQVLKKQHKQRHQQRHRSDDSSATVSLATYDEVGRRRGEAEMEGEIAQGNTCTHLESTKKAASPSATNSDSDDCSLLSTPSAGCEPNRKRAASCASSASSTPETIYRGGSDADVAHTVSSPPAEACSPVAAACARCSSRELAMQTLERECARLESEVVMLTHDYETQSHVCRELENASAALVNDIKCVSAKNKDLERSLELAIGKPDHNHEHSIISVAFLGRASLALAMAVVIFAFFLQISPFVIAIFHEDADFSTLLAHGSI